MAGINLARAGDSQFMIMQFLPVGYPAGHSADGEHNGVHIQRNTDGPEENAAVEVNIGVEITADEIVILQGRLFKVQGYVEQIVIEMQCFKDIVHLPFQYEGAWVKILINAVAKTHELERIIFVLGLFDVIRWWPARFLDILKHFYDRCVGAAVQWSPEGAHPGGHRAEQVGARTSNHPDR